jgi:hypothetical protein
MNEASIVFSVLVIIISTIMFFGILRKTGKKEWFFVLSTFFSVLAFFLPNPWNYISTGIGTLIAVIVLSWRYF